MFMPKTEMQLSDTQLRVAFDGDAVLFSDESEIIVKKHGLDTFFEHEKEFENKPLAQVNDGCFYVKETDFVQNVCLEYTPIIYSFAFLEI